MVQKLKWLVLLSSYALVGCDDMCGSDLQQKELSPNGKQQAVSFNYDCGATTGYSTQVSILQFDDSISSSGNILVTDGKNPINLEWASDNELIISHTEGLEIYKQESIFRGVKVTYE